MVKNEVAAYLIMESTMEPVKPKILQVNDKNGLFFVRFLTTLQEYNVMNRNRRKYMLGPMTQSLQAPHLLELMNKRSLFGEAGHPDTTDIKRILTIDPKLISHKINRWNMESTFLKGEIETLDDGNGYGNKMTRHILQGMIPAFSLRALAEIIKCGDGSQLVNSRAHIVTFDWVILPSHSTAYMDNSKPIQKVVKQIQSDGNTVQESMVDVLESQITDYIRMESKNVKVVSNVCDVALESMSISKDLKFAIAKEGQKTYAIKIEDKIKRDVTHFMSRF